MQHTLPERIAFYNGAPLFEKRWPELTKLLDKIFENGKFSHGDTIEEFEQAICQYTGARFAIGVNNGTDALILILRALGIGPGDEVIVPCFTFMASASSIALVGATPIFVDIHPETLSLDPSAIEKAISKKTKAIMPVHLFIQMAHMREIKKIADAHQLLLIEDSAEAIGMRYEGVHAGLLGIAGMLSFFPTKTLAALGDAGMIITNDQKIAEIVSLTRHHGRMGKTIGHMAGISHEAIYCGTNSKMDDIEAAVLLNRITHLDEDIKKRGLLANYFDERLQKLSSIKIPHFAQDPKVTNAVYYTYVIQARQRDNLMKFLNDHHIETEIYYPRPLHLQGCFQYLGYKSGAFPVAEKFCEHALALPFYPSLSLAEADRICHTIEKFYGEK